MQENDPDNYIAGEQNGNADIMWNFGTEAWCNMEGQYVTIVADLSGLSGLNY